MKMLKAKLEHITNGASLRSTGSGSTVTGVPVVHEHTGTGEGGLVDATAIVYTPAVLTDWDGDADPGDVDDALDQLAERIDDVEGAAGHSTHDAADVTYTPAVATDWDSDTDPGDVDNALDQLAERVDDLEGAGGGGGPHTLLDGSDHTDTAADTVSRGSIIVGNSTPAWDEVTVGAAGTYVRSDGTDTTFQPVSAADVDITDAGSHYTSTEVEAALQEIAARYRTKSIWIPAKDFIPAIARGSSAAPPMGTYDAGSNDITLTGIPFDSTAIEYASHWLKLPANFNGLTFTAKFVWFADSASTNSVVWGIAMLARSNDDAANTAVGTAVEVTDANTVALDILETAATGAITPSGTPAAGCMLFVEVYRDPTDGSDTLAADAWLMGVEITFGLTAAGV
ncbi:MAG: hypothetical protein M3P06_11475 [Acidobacteriota bacterium]|nr:hypothetical protein [Acidobacteriota bacterium]